MLGTGDVISRGMIMPTSDRIILALTSSQTGLRTNNSSIFFGDFTLEVNITSGSIIRADKSNLSIQRLVANHFMIPILLRHAQLPKGSIIDDYGDWLYTV